MIRAASAKMPRVEVLSLWVWGLELQPVFDSANFPLLKKLALDRASGNGAGRGVLHSKVQYSHSLKFSVQVKLVDHVT